jgi:hypothetical protein
MLKFRKGARKILNMVRMFGGAPGGGINLGAIAKLKAAQQNKGAADTDGKDSDDSGQEGGGSEEAGKRMTSTKKENSSAKFCLKKNSGSSAEGGEGTKPAAGESTVSPAVV